MEQVLAQPIVEGQNTYKCRAECQRDIEVFKEWITNKKPAITFGDMSTHSIFPDCELVFYSSLNLEKVQEIINEADRVFRDLHVMYDTVQYLNSYTGIRV